MPGLGFTNCCLNCLRMQDVDLVFWGKGHEMQICVVGLRAQDSPYPEPFGGYIGIMERNMETIIVGYIGVRV